MIPRTLQRSVRISGGVNLSKGTQVVVPVWSLHRDERNFPQALTFRPDRWAKKVNGRWVDREETDFDTSSIPPGNRKALFAFSAGARSCPGQRFAMQELVLVLSKLLKEFQFRTVDGYQLEPVKAGIVQHPKGGLPMRIRRRDFS